MSSCIHQPDMTPHEGSKWCVSTATAGSLGFRDPTHDDDTTPRWERVLHGLDPGLRPQDVAVLRQVHGSRVWRVTAAHGAEQPLADADAMVTTRTNVVLAIRVADCAPVLFSSPLGVAAAHAGWRGAAQCIGVKTLTALCDAASCQPSSVRTWIGPCISQAAFEVGSEVVDALRPTVKHLDPWIQRAGGGKWHVDLAAVVAQQLREAGVEIVCASALCTTGEAWYSYRRDAGDTGRQAAMIVRTHDLPCRE